METIVKADIFFFVTAICVFVVTALLVMILSNVLHITKNIRDIFDTIQEETSGMANDIAALRAFLRENQFGLKPLLQSFEKKKNTVEKTARAQVKKAKKTVTKVVENIKNEITNNNG